MRRQVFDAVFVFNNSAFQQFNIPFFNSALAVNKVFQNQAQNVIVFLINSMFFCSFVSHKIMSIPLYGTKKN